MGFLEQKQSIYFLVSLLLRASRYQDDRLIWRLHVNIFSCEGAAQHLHLSCVCLSVRPQVEFLTVWFNFVLPYVM